MNWPNAITLFRLLVTAFCMACLELMPDKQAPDERLAWFALVAFVFAAVTDFVDGWLARTLGQVTAFGRIADPLVDKVLVCGTFVMLLLFPIASAALPAWVVVLVITREFLVTAVRGLAESKGMAFPADRLGKLKMVVQSVTAGGLLSMVAGLGFFTEFATLSVMITLAITVVSGISYVLKARHLLFT